MQKNYFDGPNHCLVSTGQTAITPQDLEIGIQEHLVEYIPEDIILTGENRESVTLGSLIIEYLKHINRQ